jgi:hypothetical protein
MRSSRRYYSKLASCLDLPSQLAGHGMAAFQFAMIELVHQISDWCSGVAIKMGTAGILPLRFAHPVKIRSSATTPVTDLVH